MLIVFNDLVKHSDTTLDASNEATNMPVENLQNLQPSDRWRATTITSTPWVEAQLFGGVTAAEVAAWDTVAFIAYDGADSRNLLRDAHDMDLLGADNGTWVDTNVFSPTTGLGYLPTGFGSPILGISVSANALGAVHVIQTLEKPGVGGEGPVAMTFRYRAFANQVLTGDDLDLRLRLDSTTGTTGNATVDFDLSAGTTKTPTTGGGFTVDSESIFDFGDGWFLCEMVVTTNAGGTNLVSRVQLTTAAGATSIPANEGLRIAAPSLILSSADSSQSEYPITSHMGTGPMWQVKHGAGVDPSDNLSGWMHTATRNEMSDWGGRYNFYHQLVAPTADLGVRAEFWDPNNENAYIEAGRWIIGEAVDFSNDLTNVSLLVEETGGQQEADGGQIYRPQRTIRRRIELEIQYTTRAKAMDELHQMQRLQGRSRQVLVIVNPDESTFLQEYIIYGYIQTLDPMISEGQDFWSWRFTILETP